MSICTIYIRLESVVIVTCSIMTLLLGCNDEFEGTESIKFESLLFIDLNPYFYNKKNYYTNANFDWNKNMASIGNSLLLKTYTTIIKL